MIYLLSNLLKRKKEKITMTPQKVSFLPNVLCHLKKRERLK